MNPSPTDLSPSLLVSASAAQPDPTDGGTTTPTHAATPPDAGDALAVNADLPSTSTTGPHQKNQPSTTGPHQGS